MKATQKLALAALSVLALSCSVDKDYDQLTESDGIDLTVRVAKGLTMPFGSSEPIYITELMDSAKVGQLQADAAGNFLLQQGGAFAGMKIRVYRQTFPLELKTMIDVSLGDRLDFLQREGVSFVIKAPVLELRVVNDSQLPLMGDVTLTDMGQKAVHFVGLDLSNDGTGGRSVQLSNQNISEGESLDDFLSPIPEMIEAQMHIYIDPAQSSVTLPKDSVTLGGSCEVTLPLDFQSISCQHEERTADVWGTDREDIVSKVKSIEGARLQVTFVNTIPMNLSLTLVGTDAETGLETAGIVDFNMPDAIQAGTLQNPVTTEVSGTLSVPATRRLGDLIYRIKGQGSDSRFNAHQYVQIKEASLSLPDGVNVDLN